MRGVELHAHCFWCATRALRQPVIEAETRDSAERMLTSIVRFGTPAMKVRAANALSEAIVRQAEGVS